VVFGYHSLALALEDKYGKAAAVVFGLTTLIRLFNEVWSNSAVVGSYFGPYQSGVWWVACILASAIPCTLFSPIATYIF
jgi:SSS family solute:Na+ symporter